MSDLVHFDRPPQPQSDQPDWAQKLRNSDRPDALVKAIIGLVTMLESRAGRLQSAIAIPEDASPASIAEHVTHESRKALDAFVTDAGALVEKRAPKVLDLYGDYAATKTGAASIDVERFTEQFIATVKDALGDSVTEVRKALDEAVTYWFHNGGSVEELRDIVRGQLEDVQWQAARTMRTELQEAYKDLVRQGLRDSGTGRVYRQAQASACEFCVAKEGEYDADDPECWDTHPNCQDVWYALDADGKEIGEAEAAEMSNLSKAERDKLPASDFALPSKRLYPILDQDDVDSAAKLIGKHPEAKAGVIRLAKRKGLKLPKAWQDEQAKHSRFTLGASVTFSGETVRRKGKIFEAGDYPDKQFRITPEEMFEAVAEFSPVANDLEHIPTVLSGKLGTLASVELGEDPYDLIGEVELPKWLSDECPDELPVSVAWNRSTKRIEGLALVVEPRVATAAVAAFAKRHDTPQGQSAMQELHDIAARRGAVCQPPKAEMSSKHESTAIQQVHDISAEHGARCATTAMRSGIMPYFSNRRGFAMPKMSSLFKFWEHKGRPDEIDLEELAKFSESESGTPAPAQPTANMSAQPDPRVASLESEVAKLKAEKILSDAAAFAAAEITAFRSLPSDEADLVEEFTIAAMDDAKFGVVTFSEGKTSSRVEALKARHAKRPAHMLTKEMLPPGLDAEALFNRQTTPTSAEKPMTQERRAALLGMTGVGRDVLSNQN